jgi:hypothetical protein
MLGMPIVLPLVFWRICLFGAAVRTDQSYLATVFPATMTYPFLRMLFTIESLPMSVGGSP